MAEYPRVDPYKRARYDRGVDAKIVVMGNTGVGKTSLLHRYTAGKFDPKNTVSTTGAFFVTKKIDVGGVKVRLQLWDTAGQERFRSMAPMYYRGANAALLLYDITNLASFQDIRGWLEELKRNCDPELLIYIVGAKADLDAQRQVSSDYARLSLHNWFPPPPKSPPAVPSAATGTFAYIRPRFTSFTSMRSLPPAPSPPAPERERERAHGHSQSVSFGRSSGAPPAPSSPTMPQDPPPSTAGSPPSALRRSNTGAVTPAATPRTRARAPSVPLARAHSAGPGAVMSPSRFGLPFGSPVGGWRPLAADESGSSGAGEDGTAGGEDDEDDYGEWGLGKRMELFEASAKDGAGIQALFESLIGAIVTRKDAIEAENELKKRDSVALAPAWAASADAEAADEKARSAGRWGCCGI